MTEGCWAVIRRAWWLLYQGRAKWRLPRRLVKPRIIGVSKRLDEVVSIILMLPDIVSKSIAYCIIVAFRLAIGEQVVGVFLQ